MALDHFFFKTCPKATTQNEKIAHKTGNWAQKYDTINIKKAYVKKV